MRGSLPPAKRLTLDGIKVYIFLFSVNLGAVLAKKNLRLKDILILFDRNSGVSIFQNFRGYDDPVDDAEWILERNPKTKGFILRPVSCGDEDGLWIGEYVQDGNAIVRSEVLFDEGALQVGRLIANYIRRRITEREVMENLSINLLKERLRSEIVRGFKYYECPINNFYYTCGEFKRMYEILKGKYGDDKVPYSKVADDILALAECSEAVICPLKVPNAFERIYNLNRALKIRGLGEIKFTSPGIVQIA